MVAEPHIGLTITTMAGAHITAETWRITPEVAAALRAQLGEPSTRQLVPVEAADAVIADVRHVVDGGSADE
jgi:hypothetical protein